MPISTIQILKYVQQYAIRWIVIYPVDSAIRRLNNRGQNFKKPSDIFSPQIERKRPKEYLVLLLAVKESFERFSCFEFIFKKSKHREAGLKHKQGFSETL